MANILNIKQLIMQNNINMMQINDLSQMFPDKIESKPKCLSGSLLFFILFEKSFYLDFENPNGS